MGILASAALLMWGCNEEPTPRDGFTSSGGISAGGGAGSRGDGDQESDVGVDAGDEEEENDGDGEEFCQLEPRAGDVPGRPCCFEDVDCLESDAPGAELMRCYRSECREGGEGICLFEPLDTNECWEDQDCEEGEFCQGAIIGSCEDPLFEGDQPGYCR